MIWKLRSSSIQTLNSREAGLEKINIHKASDIFAEHGFSGCRPGGAEIVITVGSAPGVRALAAGRPRVRRIVVPVPAEENGLEAVEVETDSSRVSPDTARRSTGLSDGEPSKPGIRCRLTPSVISPILRGGSNANGDLE